MGFFFSYVAIWNKGYIGYPRIIIIQNSNGMPQSIGIFVYLFSNSYALPMLFLCCIQMFDWKVSCILNSYRTVIDTYLESYIFSYSCVLIILFLDISVVFSLGFHRGLT